MTEDISQIHQKLYRCAMLIRTAEQSLLKLFSEGKISGTVHTALGQEISQATVGLLLNHPSDAVFASHRNHGYLIAYSDAVEGMISEIMGKKSGLCKGRGGSQHTAIGHFHSNGILGGTSPIAAGLASAMQRKGDDGIVAVCLGDGAMGEGVVYESMNLAAVWQAPVMFIVEANGIAQSTRIADSAAGDLLARAEAFGLRTLALSDDDPHFYEKVRDWIELQRENPAPSLLRVETARMGPHSKSDDHRSREEMDFIFNRDPVAAIGRKLTAEVRESIDREVAERVEKACADALASEDALETVEELNFFAGATAGTPVAIDSQGKTVGASINQALDLLLSKNERALFMGEDICDPYGGAFKISKGLSDKFPERVINTPISESAIAGAGIGLALGGYSPIIEIMFADFLTLVIDQVLNQALKLSWLDSKVKMPLVIRAPSGGHRGYGPTHSQSPEMLFAALPGMTVVAPSHRHNVAGLLYSAGACWDYPTLFAENKILYGAICDAQDYVAVAADERDTAGELFPTLTQGGADADLTIVTYGGALLYVEEAAEKLRNEEELSVNIIVPSLLSPLPAHTLLAQLKSSKRVLIVEEGSGKFGFGSEIIALMAENGIRIPARRLAAADCPIPAARTLEKTVLPDCAKVIAAAVDLFS